MQARAQSMSHFANRGNHRFNNLMKIPEKILFLSGFRPWAMRLGIMSVFRALPTLLEAWQLLSPCVGAHQKCCSLPTLQACGWLGLRGVSCRLESHHLSWGLCCALETSYTVVPLSLHQVCGSHTQKSHRTLESPLLRVRELR